MKTVFITGANKGIGFHLARQFFKHDEAAHVFLGSRSSSRGEVANTAIRNEFPAKLTRSSFIELDVMSDISVGLALNKLAKQSVDLVYNNAGIKVSDSYPGQEKAKITFETNYLGVRRVTEEFIKGNILNKNALVVSSVMISGKPIFKDESTNKKLENVDSFVKLDELAEEYMETVRSTEIQNTIWKPKFPFEPYYFASKAFMYFYMRLLAERENNYVVITASPGFCDTEMTAKVPGKKRTAEEGAIDLFNLRNETVSGNYWEKGKSVKM